MWRAGGPERLIKCSGLYGFLEVAAVSLSAHEQRTLSGIADELAASDPKLASILSVFNRLTKEFVDQLCQDTGGPCTYTGLNMRQAHTNMGVTSGEFDAFMEDLVATLDGFNVGKAEQDELLNNLRPMRAEIVEVDSPQVGTPLPSAFTPAPPL